MEVDESCRELLTINTHKGLYQYNRLQFGVASARAVWQRAMEQVLQGIPFTSCILDDMIISGKTDDEHLANLGAVLERLERFGLRANLEKCEFFKEQVTYCGHVISEKGLRKSPDKVNAVLNAPQPENVQQLRSFLGLVNYYRSFLPNLSTVLGPLNELLQGDIAWILDTAVRQSVSGCQGNDDFRTGLMSLRPKQTRETCVRCISVRTRWRSVTHHG